MKTGLVVRVVVDFKAVLRAIYAFYCTANLKCWT